MDILHLKAMYSSDEEKPDYLYSGGNSRTTAILSEINSMKGLQFRLVKVRMRHPLGKSGPGKGDLLEINFTPLSLLQRILAFGLLSSRGMKQAELILQYIVNRFDVNTLLKHLVHAETPTLLFFDDLPSFSFLTGKVLKNLKDKCRLLYLSHNYEPDFLGNRILASFARKKMKTALTGSDLIIVCSSRDKISYALHRETGEDNILVYPNIFPPTSCDLASNVVATERLTIAVVQGSWWNSKSSLSRILEFAYVLRNLSAKRGIKVVAIGKLLTQILQCYLTPSINYEGIRFIPDRVQFLRKLSEAQIGINLADNIGGTNTRKYDYALSGLVILSSSLGARGEILPHEYVYTDVFDLESKLGELINFNQEELRNMGEENKKRVLKISQQASAQLQLKIRKLLS